MDEFEAWAATIPWMHRPPAYVLSLDLRTRRDSEEQNRLIKSLRFSPAEGLALLTRRREEYLEEMRAFCARFTRPPGDRLFTCGAGKESGCVDAYGRFQLCMQCRHPDTVYDLRAETRFLQETGFLGLENALTNFFPQAREIRATNPDYLARCARCFLKGLCDQCPAKSWQEHGTLDTPVEYLCDVAHAKARYLGLLAEGENAWEVGDWHERTMRFSREGSH